MLAENLLYNQFFWLGAAALLIIARALSIRYQDGLNKYNGPFVASFTNFWRLWQAYWYQDRVTYLPLPHKYGEIIRLGPRTLVFQNPQAIRDIFVAGFRKVRAVNRYSFQLSRELGHKLTATPISRNNIESPRVSAKG